MYTDLLKEYADLKIKEKQIKKRIDELSPEIKKNMLTAGIDKQPTSVGNFVIISLKKWKYSEAVAHIEEQLDTTKMAEQADGTATFVEVPSLKFIENKDGSDDQV